MEREREGGERERVSGERGGCGEIEKKRFLLKVNARQHTHTRTH